MDDQFIDQNLLVRAYHLKDLDHMVSMWHASKRDAFPYVEVQQRYSIEDDRWYFQEILVKEFDIWVAEIDDRIVGMMAIKGKLINQLFVDVEHQGLGVGTKLLEVAKELSPDYLQAFTFQKNVKARAFFEKHGFHAVRFFVSPPPENEPDVEYAWTPGESQKG
jgi:ribosomal protein S18 acetylase RimI-like enzyme